MTDIAKLAVLLQRGKEFYRFVAHGPDYDSVVKVIEHEASRKACKAPEEGMIEVSVRDTSGTEEDSFQSWREQ
jgi:hypothetical protein